MTPQELQTIKQRFEIIGNSPALNYAIQIAAQVAPTDLTVLITGESGSGKESFSKIIHNLSARKHGQFIAINCGAIPEGTIDSELFGHEKGSFTGATDARKGYFEVTSGGTIFLDEIGEMPLGTQARLLRVLENGEFIKVGSSKVLKTDVRIVAATNVNLLAAVDKGSFREDLYYRLNTVPIHVPPLRERGNDIELLFRKFASDFAEKYRIKSIRLLEDARDLIVRYRFPGNIRQLKNIAEQISVLELDRDIDHATLSKYLPDENRSNLPMSLRGQSADTFNEQSLLSDRQLLFTVLNEMRRDIGDLKRVVGEIIKGGTVSGTELGEGLSSPSFAEFAQAMPISSKPEPFVGSATFSKPEPTAHNHNLEVEEFHFAEEVTGKEESLSLNEKEKEMILKALKKNNNKRKYAALDLGISERTLYRKIKEFNIEE